MDDRLAALNLMDVSRETVERLDILSAELLRWQSIKNLVAPSTLSQIWTRHIVDSLQLVALAPFARSWADLGSGGGFPGLVIAAAMAERGSSHVTLIESNARKCAFLRETARAMDVDVVVMPARIEDVLHTLSGPVDVVTARALSPLPKLVEWTHKLLTNGTVALFPKGRDLQSELTDTAKCWRLSYQIYNSLTDKAGRILEISSAARL